MNRKRTNALFMLVLAAALAVSACGGGGGGGSTPPPPPPPPAWQGTLITSPTIPFTTAFVQSLVSQDTGTYNEVFPRCANVWTIDQDFTLVDGFDSQFDWALLLTVSSGLTSSTDFPSDQQYSDLTFYTPVSTVTNNLKVAAVSDGSTVMPSLSTYPTVKTVITGTYAAFLNATSDSRLQQTLDLTSLPTPTHIDLSWDDAVSLDPGALSGYDAEYQVVIRKLDGTLLKTILTPERTSNGGNGFPEHHSKTDSLTEFAGQTVVLSFEAHSSNTPFGIGGGQAYAIVDTVSVKNRTNSHEYVTNGSFESGDLTGWTTNAGTLQQSQNMTSGARTLEGLDVKRSFYTSPDKLWGRWVDVFENHTASAISRTVTYDTVLGALGTGVIYDPVTLSTVPTTTTRALTAWDDVGNRDVGLVFGHATTIDSTSIADTIDVTYDITVPAGGRVAIVNFVLMDGIETGKTALSFDPSTDATARAAVIDTEAQNILNNFWTDVTYRTGMTQQQIDAVVNFAN